MLPGTDVPAGRDDAPDLDLRERARPDRPWTCSNFATSLDGRIAIDGHARGIGSAEDLRLLHHLRTFCDALVIGAGTMRAERYGPVLRGEGRIDVVAARRARGQADHPLLVVVTASFDLPWDAPAFTSGIGEVVVATSAPEAVEPPPTATPVSVWRRGDGALVDLPRLWNDLRATRDVRQLLCEGGAHLHREVVDAGLLDELFVTIAPRLVGEAGAPTLLAGGPLADGGRPVDLDLVSARRLEGELFTRWRIARDG
jgi:riboflavin-specific deaminase-like protein